MKKLSATWFIEGNIDLEYQQYILLDYLQNIKNSYKDLKLYPSLSDLILQRENLLSFKEKKSDLFNIFPKKISGINWEEQKINYQTTEEDDIFKIINEIIDFALPLIETYLEMGRAIYQAIEKEMILEPIGIQPIYKKEGYILIEINNTIQVFQFKVSPLEMNSEKFVGINIEHVNTYELTLTNTNEKIKKKLIEANKNLPHPATYFVKIKKDFSKVLNESILPIIKRKIITIS